MKKLTILILILTIGTFQYSFAQLTKRQKRILEKRDKKLKESFPPVLDVVYPKSSLGEKIQNLYKSQAEESCGIIRVNERLYIPKEIISGFGDDKLRNTLVYDFPMSATNLLFLTLTESDVSKINNGSFIDSEYINSKRIIGQNNNLVNYGQSILQPINGFPSLYYQKSCGSYFVGNLGTKVEAPILEIQTSLVAETNKETSITTITGKFYSPLYLIFRQNTPQSVYAHMLLWEIYFEQNKNKPTESLIDKGYYISEFDATISNRANNSKQSLNMNSRLSTNISIGVFGLNSEIKAGQESKVSFSMKDFNTSIHKLGNDKLSYALTNLPNVRSINAKLQNSLIFGDQPSYNGFVTHLLPTEISRVMIGIPSFLCNSDSWYVTEEGYDRTIWKNKPSVKSNFKKNSISGFPECICEVKGYLNKNAISKAINGVGTIDINLKLANRIEINKNQLILDISEPAIKVTDAPKVLAINSDVINASRTEVKSSTKVHYNYPIQFTIDDTGIKLKEPFEIKNIVIEYVNKEQNDFFKEQIQNLNINSNTVSFDLKTREFPLNYVDEGNISSAIKVKFSIQLEDGFFTQIVTNTINLKVPNLVEKSDFKPKVSLRNSN